MQPDFLKFLDANEQVMYRIKREKEFGAEKLEKQRGKKVEFTVALFQWLIPANLSR